MKTENTAREQREEMNTDQNVPEETGATASPQAAETQSLQSPRRVPFWTALVAFIAFAIILVFFIMSGIRNRMDAQTSLKEETQKSAVITVKTIHPKKEAPVQEITLPGNVQAYT